MISVLYRVESMFEFFNIAAPDREGVEKWAAAAAQRAQNMTALQDYQALAAVLLYVKPKRIFEIGTYLGGTSEFFLNVLPECRVVSIAYINPLLNVFGRKFNNSELSRKEVGVLVSEANKHRFHQLYGNSHDLVARDLLAEFGPFDLVFVDGDHSREGVHLDTELAKQIIQDAGTICWHDANPKKEYLPVRRYLENELPLCALATSDRYVGGVACWNRRIENAIHESRSVRAKDQIRTVQPG